MKIELNNEMFFENLSITQAYCAEQMIKYPKRDAGGVFRTINFKIAGKNIYEIILKDGGDSYVSWNIDPLRFDNFYKIAFDESIRIKKSIAASNHLKPEFGKILVAEVHQTVCDGASSVECENFIDDNDCPAIDTWFYYCSVPKVGDILFAWVPQKYVAMVDNAIAVNCVDILYWLNELPDRSLKSQSLEVVSIADQHPGLFLQS
ncbi:MAG: hypothetical protein ACO3EE_02475 [Flavobacteriales bacterium]